MPKQRITRDMVIDAAFSLAREQGMDQVLVKNLAQRLQCSVQPIYSYCKNMEDLRSAVEEKARSFADAFIRPRMDPNDYLLSVCRAYLLLAEQEPHLFRILSRQRRENVSGFQDLPETSAGVDLYIARQLGLSTDQAKQLQTHLLIYIMGLGTAFSESRPGIPAHQLLQQLESVYSLLLKQSVRKRSSR